MKKILFLLCALLLSQPEISASHFRHYTIEDGMSVNAVYCITQDSKGFMWFGTIDGLNRFDGRSIRQFRSSSEEQDVPLGNIIYALCEDNRQRLWIGSDGGGATIFDLVTERFEPFTAKTDSGVGIVKTVAAFHMDGDTLWIGTNGQGVFRYDLATGHLTQYAHDAADRESLCSDHILRIYRDSRGALWFTSLDNGVSCLDAGAEHLHNYALSPPPR